MHAPPPRPEKRIHPLRDALIAAVFTFVTSAVGLSIVYSKARDAQLEAVRREMLQLARAAAANVDGDLHRMLVSPEQEGSPEHERLLEPLVRMHRSMRDVWYVYTAIMRNERVYWMVDTSRHYRVPGNTDPPNHLWTLFEERDPAFERALREGREYTDAEPRLLEGHNYMSAYAPFHDHAGTVVGLLGIDMALDARDANVAAFRRPYYIALGVVFLLSIGAGLLAHHLRKFAASIVRKMRDARADAERNAAAAQSAARAKASFLAMMSHEIRTPMNGILGVADLLRTMAPDKEQKRLLDILTSSGGSLLRIINDILDFSKMEADRLELHPRPFELRALADELEHLLAPTARAKDVQFHLELDPELPQGVSGDRERLSQVLLNLGTNAVKFTDRGHVRLAIRALERAGDMARIEFSVRDTGIGMDPETLARLFTPFTQFADRHRHRGGGTGLGLVIARKLVGLMGGEIGVRSAPGAGTTFNFSIVLPLAQVTGTTSTVAALRLDSIHVLVAEDNAVNQAIVAAMLRSLGHRSTLATTGREALEALAREPFDLVLMDCNMPELDGIEATRRLRAGDCGVRDAHIPVIALTANAMEGDREACLAAGMNDFLAKPVTIAALREAIDRTTGGGGGAGQQVSRLADQQAAVARQKRG